MTAAALPPWRASAACGATARPAPIASSPGRELSQQGLACRIRKGLQSAGCLAVLGLFTDCTHLSVRLRARPAANVAGLCPASLNCTVAEGLALR